MTLLEAIIAFVILSVVGIVCLDQARGAVQLQAASAEWTRAIAQGESALSEATAETAATPVAASSSATASTVRVERRPWRSGVDQIAVTVSLTNGATFVLTRLTPSAPVRR